MSPSRIDPSSESSTEKVTNRDDSNVEVAPPNNHEPNSPSQTRSTPGRQTPPTVLATRSASDEPSEDTELTMWATYIDERAFDNDPSVTLQDEILGHGSDVNVNKAYAIPPLIVPDLLQGISEVSPSRLSLDKERSILREADENASDSGDGLPGYSATEKGKWKAQTDGDDIHTGWVGKSSPDFDLETPDNTVEEWVVGTKDTLQHYEDHQVSLPLGPRLEVTPDESSKFILGVLKLLVNRDQPGCTDPSRQLGSCCIENFMDIKRWAKEYFRSRHAMGDVESSILTLLTIVLNNFYQGQVQLIDRIVTSALDNMRNSGRISLSPGDFAFGFDFRMSQDMPFSVETSSKISKGNPVPAAVPPLTSEPVVTHSGRQVKPTERAQAASQQAQPDPNGRRNKGANSSQPKDEEATESAFPYGGKKKGSTQPSYQRTAKATSMPSPDAVKPAPAKTTSERTKHRPARPSNLGSSTSGTTRSHSEDSCKSEHINSASTDSPKVCGSEGSHPTINSTPRLSIKIPAARSRTSSVPATGDSELTLDTTSRSTPQPNPLADAGETTTQGTPRPGIARPRGRHNGRGRGRGRGRKRGSAMLTPSMDGSTALAVDNSTGTDDDDPSTAQNTQKSELLPPPTDPGHPQGKKRKLDDSED